jgi:hypothetical protein
MGGLAKAKSADRHGVLASTLAIKVKQYRTQAEKYVLLGNTFQAALDALNGVIV